MKSPVPEHQISEAEGKLEAESVALALTEYSTLPIVIGTDI